MPNGTYGGVGGKGAKENLSLPDLPDCPFPFNPLLLNFQFEKKKSVKKFVSWRKNM